VVEAGAIANEVLARPEIETRMKSDRSPVSEADERVEEFLMEALERELPGVARIAEEAAARGETPPHGDAFLLIDPIDGTREFIGRSPEFTVNLALVDKLTPVAGAIFAPAGARVWFAGAQGFTAKAVGGGALPPAQDWSALRVRPRPAHGLTALLSKSHPDDETVALLAALPIRERRPMGSSLKFCVIAQGKADIYPRFGRTMEWDTAAGDAILRAAGGAVLTPTGEPLTYGKATDFYRNGPFIAWGDARQNLNATLY
jgi:3'(2'), 5'-bisphosphate nucleotidase